MMEEARTDATNRMVKQAEEMGADAVVAVRYATSRTVPVKLSFAERL